MLIFIQIRKNFRKMQCCFVIFESALFVPFAFSGAETPKLKFDNSVYFINF